METVPVLQALEEVPPPSLRRWFVLTRTTLYTFKERKVYSSPTEVIRLNTITHTSCAEEKARDHVFVRDSSFRGSPRPEKSSSSRPVTALRRSSGWDR